MSAAFFLLFRHVHHQAQRGDWHLASDPYAALDRSRQPMLPGMPRYVFRFGTLLIYVVYLKCTSLDASGHIFIVSNRYRAWYRAAVPIYSARPVITIYRIRAFFTYLRG